MRTVLVVGGGPAGLAAAIHAARAGAATLLLERNDQCGVKLLATGGGHCNLSNLRPPAEWPGLFGRRGRFILPALQRLPRERLQAWLAEMGEPLACPDGFHCFPASRSAKAVRDALVRAATAAGVRMLPASRVSGLVVDAGRVTGVSLAGGGGISGDAVVVATGGASRPATGSTWDGARMAEAVGHRVRPPVPGLVGLRVGNLSPDLAGIVLPDAEAVFETRGRPAQKGRGELLFTHAGVSGPAVLDLSASVAEARETGGGTLAEGTRLVLRWLAGGDAGFWSAELESWRKGKGGGGLAGRLRERLPFRLARWLCLASGVSEDARAAALRAGERDRLLAVLSRFPAAVAGTEGWDKAMITRGGVDLREVRPETLASRLARGLYFAGETLDLDGPCGGYNLHWAFAGGALAGECAAGEEEE